MKLTPSSTARRKTFFAFSRSGGQPQIPSPVKRIAPKPSRLTKRSPPNSNVESLASGSAARSFDKSSVKTPAAPAEITSKNVLRLIVGKICCHAQFSTLTCHAVASAEEVACRFSRSLHSRFWILDAECRMLFMGTLTCLSLFVQLLTLRFLLASCWFICPVDSCRGRELLSPQLPERRRSRG